MSRVYKPSNAGELKALQCLLTIFDNIGALDATGNDIFAYVNELRNWPMEYVAPDLDYCGSYKQDLWYCVLARSKLDVRHNVQPCKRLARYTNYYTPKHYLALCHLDDWNWYDVAEFSRQIQPVLQKYPLSSEEEHIQRELELRPKRVQPSGSDSKDSDYGSGNNDGSERNDESTRYSC